MPITLKEAKENIGKVIYGLPWGDEAKYSPEAKEFEIISVGRKFVRLSEYFTYDGKSKKSEPISFSVERGVT